MGMKRFSYLVTTVLALALFATSCGGDDEVDAGDLPLITAGTLTVCTDAPWPPMEVILDDGTITGFDIELIRAIADEIGLETEVKVIGFDSITSGLAMESGECDISVASITILEEREENVDFSDPYFDAYQSLLVSTESGITDLDGLAGQNLAVQTGTTGEIFAQDNAADANIISFENAGDMMTALVAGEVVGVLQDIVPNQDYADNNDDAVIAATFDTDEEYGFVVKEEGAEDLLDAVNDALKVVQDNGTYDDIYDDWFTN
jgi:polar amino acid transport system substrate-binding protein